MVLKEGVDYSKDFGCYYDRDDSYAKSFLLELVTEDDPKNETVGLYYDSKLDTVILSGEGWTGSLLFEKDHLIDILSKLEPTKGEEK